MNATGKAARRQNGLNHAGCHRANHKPKSDAKRKRMGWIKGRKTKP
jgi:hypothetical protein